MYPTNFSIFICTFASLRLVCGEEKLWEYPKPSSTMFCRPIYFKFANENKLKMEKQALIQDEIAALEPTIIGNITVNRSKALYWSPVTKVNKKKNAYDHIDMGPATHLLNLQCTDLHCQISHFFMQCIWEQRMLT